MPRDEGGGRVPIGGRDLDRPTLGLLRLEKTGVPAIKAERLTRSDRLHQIDEIGDALLAPAEHVGQLPRHGDGVERGRGEERKRRLNRRIELAATGQDRAGNLGDVRDEPILDAGDFHIGAAQIPTDDACHGPSLRQTGGLFKPGNGARGLMHDEFAVVPVIDLKGGLVVHARTGARAAYRPIETPLGPADNPIAIARALLAITASPALYIADLDAIDGAGNHFDLCRDLADALPATALWIDAGFSNVTDCAFWLPLGATLVIGSESLPAIGNWHELHSTYGESLVLSLDFAAEGLRGPTAHPVGACGVARTGSSPCASIASAPMKARTSSACGMWSRRPGTRAVYGAGGLRRIGDLEAIAAAGAKGALIATALHEGAITQNEIAAFLQRRRSQFE